VKFILFTWVTPEGDARWNALTGEERAADIDRHRAWFGRFGASITAGEELGDRRSFRVVRRSRDGWPLATDGPFAETKEWIGGFIVVDVADRAEAEAMAAEWPGLGYPGHAVEIVPTGETTP
jgi:hypothetical protein